ncbi:MAG TPA: AAA family ATPase [Alphaproteobacteria bacterium]
MIDQILLDFYRYNISLFFEEKEPENYFSYKGFYIQGFRGLDNVTVNFSKNDLVLLLGLNESGKTSILKAIEAFDFNNDPEPKELKTFFTSIRNKQDIECSTPCTITAQIEFTEQLPSNFFKKVLKAATFEVETKTIIDEFLERINAVRSVRISRVIPFMNGNAGKSYYKFEGEKPFSDPKLEAVLAQEMVRRCPFIMYFEDFQDSIPEKIYTSKRSEAFNHVWYEIIDGLFYNTDKNYSIKKYLGYFSKSNRRDDDARTVLKKVNKTLQETFTKKWKDLSGVQEIEVAEIDFDEAKKCFEIKITEKDGTTYSVHERSKGAVWYLAFLMKTEFRRKKLREGSGKPVYLIDEPASNLHSTAQQKMVEDFYKLVEDTALIYTTHSQYLISPSNVKNTYVVQRNDGLVHCTRWSDYIKGKDAKTSYYQPLYDCLNIVPNNFSIPWQKAIITEGPSDALVLEVMENLFDEEPTHAIYPGTSASDLKDLISLNIGWGADFKILLDSDDEGIIQKKSYMDQFGLPEEMFVMIPEGNKEIEYMFSEAERCSLYELSMGEKVKEVSKKQFLAMFRTLAISGRSKKSEIKKLLSRETQASLFDLLKALKSEAETKSQRFTKVA